MRQFFGCFNCLGQSPQWWENWHFAAWEINDADLLEQGVDFRVCVEVPVIVEMAELVPAIDFDALAKTDASLRAEPWWDADFGETALTFIKKVRAGSLNTYPLTDRVWRPFGLIQDHGHWFWVADCLNSSGANAHGQ